MINVNGTDFYDAHDLTEILNLSYPMVAKLLAKRNIPKYKGKYIVNEEQLEEIKNRPQQYLNFSKINLENFHLFSK